MIMGYPSLVVGALKMRRTRTKRSTVKMRRGRKHQERVTKLEWGKENAAVRSSPPHSSHQGGAAVAAAAAAVGKISTLKSDPNR